MEGLDIEIKVLNMAPKFYFFLHYFYQPTVIN